MRLLFVTPTLPAPTSGGRTRLFNLLKQLAARHRVSILSFVQPGEDDIVANLEPYCRNIELVSFDGFKTPGLWTNRIQGWAQLLFSRRPAYARTFPVDSMRIPLRDLVSAHDFDVVLFEQLFLAELLREVGGLPAVLVEQNVESDIARRRYANATNPVHKLRDWLAWQKLLSFESRWLRLFPICVAVSERDAALLRQMVPDVQVLVVPNGVDTQEFAAPAGERDRESLLFFGSLRYGPNAEGLLWFCDHVLPRVWGARPDVRLRIVGSNPPPSVLNLGHSPGIQVLGFVPDIRDQLWSASIAIVPLLVGGGTRLKVLEALAAGCPAVSTTVGAEGLSLRDREDLIIADTAIEFADGVVSLLESAELRSRLARSGRDAVERRFDWQSIAPSLEAACSAAIEQSASD